MKTNIPGKKYTELVKGVMGVIEDNTEENHAHFWMPYSFGEEGECDWVFCNICFEIEEFSRCQHLFKHPEDK